MVVSLPRCGDTSLFGAGVAAAADGGGRAMMRWWDDVVFEKYPSWDECEQAGFFSGLILWLPRGRGRRGKFPTLLEFGMWRPRGCGAGDAS